ncbi:hypothetical protein ACFYZI_17525 [Streptomyces griseorubiginosus]|uniref:hypothetical protein n=1 Tax=Streptomyces griseorubiginosus TaxID=67304 RepID=UPI00369E64B0
MQHVSALKFLQWLAANPEVMWVLDDNGKKAPNVSTSTLYSEYHSTLPPQSFPLALLANFLTFGRVKFSARPDQGTRNKIRNLVPRNRMDQVVLGAAFGADDRLLVSNDEDDFSPDVREAVLADLGVLIICSFELEA